MKKAYYFMGIIILFPIFICGIGLPGKTGSPVPVSSVESEQKNEAVTLITAGGQTEKEQPSQKEDKPQQQPNASPKANQFPKKGIPVLMYHSISSMKKNSLCVSEKQFREEMDLLNSHGFHTLSADKFYDALKNQGPLPENPVLITFDDGYPDNYTAARAILKQYGFTATFFIVTRFVNTSGMNWGQLKELIVQGNSIGSHTVNHYDLSTLSAAQQKKEIAGSKQILEEKLGVPIRAFCFPSSKYNKTTLKLLSEFGYSIAFTTKSGKVHSGDNPFLLKRVRIWRGMTTSQFMKLVA